MRRALYFAILCTVSTCHTMQASPPNVGAAKPAWPAPQSRCVFDQQCADGLVCATLDISMMPPTDIPRGGPSDGDTVCQPGCRIDGTFHYPDVRDDYPNNCQSCQPDTDTTAWTAVVAGTACRDSAGECDLAESCDGTAGACPNDAPLEKGRFRDEHACPDRPTDLRRTPTRE